MMMEQEARNEVRPDVGGDAGEWECEEGEGDVHLLCPTRFVQQ